MVADGRDYASGTREDPGSMLMHSCCPPHKFPDGLLACFYSLGTPCSRSAPHWPTLHKLCAVHCFLATSPPLVSPRSRTAPRLSLLAYTHTTCVFFTTYLLPPPHLFLPHYLQSVGTTPVITGKALKTTYHVTESYIEISIDVSVSPSMGVARGCSSDTNSSAGRGGRYALAVQLCRKELGVLARGCSGD